MVQGEFSVSRGTIIYVGEFVLPDKGAAANRVVSNGKLFNSLGYRTVFLGASESAESFDSIRPIYGHNEMYEQAHPETAVQWIRHTLSTKDILALVEKYDDVKMVVLYNLPVITLCLIKRALKRWNIEVAYDCTEWTNTTSGSTVKKVFKYIDEIAVRRLAHRIADRMIVISTMMEGHYREAKKVLRLPPLVDTDDEIWHQTPEEHNGIFEFCFAGVPDGKKESLGKVVEAFRCINEENAQLRIIGVTEEEFKDLYPEIALTPEAEKKIVFMGMLPHKQVIKHLLGCDCCVCFRESDRRNNAGFPTKFAEAFTCNVPIITTAVSDVGEYMKEENCGQLLENPQIQTIRAAMLDAIKKGCRKKTEVRTVFDYRTYQKSCRDWINR